MSTGQITYGTVAYLLVNAPLEIPSTSIVPRSTSNQRHKHNAAEDGELLLNSASSDVYERSWSLTCLINMSMHQRQKPMGFDSILLPNPILQLTRSRHHMQVPRKAIIERPRIIQHPRTSNEIMLQRRRKIISITSDSNQPLEYKSHEPGGRT